MYWLVTAAEQTTPKSVRRINDILLSSYLSGAHLVGVHVCIRWSAQGSAPDRACWGWGPVPCVSPPPPGRLASEQGVEAGGGGVGGTQGSVEGALGYLAARTHRICESESL